MLAFPIVLMLVLGTALSNTFTTSLRVDDIDVLYKDTTKGEDFPHFIAAAEKSGLGLKKQLVRLMAKRK